MWINDDKIREAYPSIRPFLYWLERGHFGWYLWQRACDNIRRKLGEDNPSASVVFSELMRDARIKNMEVSGIRGKRVLCARLLHLFNLIVNIYMLIKIRQFLMLDKIWEDGSDDFSIGLYNAIDHGMIYTLDVLSIIDELNENYSLLEESDIDQDHAKVFTLLNACLDLNNLSYSEVLERFIETVKAMESLIERRT